MLSPFYMLPQVVLEYFSICSTIHFVHSTVSYVCAYQLLIESSSTCYIYTHMYAVGTVWFYLYLYNLHLHFFFVP